MATMGSPLDEFHLLLFHLGDQGICAKDQVTDIPINKGRRTRYSFCTEEEVSQLRTLLGSLAWLAKKLDQI